MKYNKQQCGGLTDWTRQQILNWSHELKPEQWRGCCGRSGWLALRRKWSSGWLHGSVTACWLSCCRSQQWERAGLWGACDTAPTSQSSGRETVTVRAEAFHTSDSGFRQAQQAIHAMLLITGEIKKKGLLFHSMLLHWPRHASHLTAQHHKQALITFTWTPEQHWWQNCGKDQVGYRLAALLTDADATWHTHPPQLLPWAF